LISRAEEGYLPVSLQSGEQVVAGSEEQQPAEKAI
jgi:hypothetical protein